MKFNFTKFFHKLLKKCILITLFFFPGLRLDNIPSDMIRLTVQVSDSNQFEPASTDSATVEIAVIGKKDNNAVNFKKKIIIFFMQMKNNNFLFLREMAGVIIFPPSFLFRCQRS